MEKKRVHTQDVFHCLTQLAFIVLSGFSDNSSFGEGFLMSQGGDGRLLKCHSLSEHRGVPQMIPQHLANPTFLHRIFSPFENFLLSYEDGIHCFLLL